jgi:hypothetical protein
VLLSANSQAELYIRPESSSPSGPYHSVEIGGCAFAHGREVSIGRPAGFSSQGGGGIDEEVLAGHLVAYERVAFPGPQSPFGATYVVIVRDLRSGRLLREMPNGAPRLGSKQVGAGPTRAIVLRADGGVAWIVEDEARRAARPVYDVYAADRTGTRLLASGEDVDPSSLALVGHRLYWLRATVPATAILY